MIQNPDIEYHKLAESMWEKGGVRSVLHLRPPQQRPDAPKDSKSIPLLNQ